MLYASRFHGYLILSLWLGWTVFWLMAAIGNKRTQRREPLASRLAYILAVIVGGVLLSSQRLPWSALLGLRLWPRSAAAYWTGVAVLAAGLAFSVWARLHLGRNWSGTVTVKEDHELIRTGPYGYVRHPIYTGLLTAILGTMICAGTLRAVGVLAIVTVALLLKARTEERFMRETFPGQYEKYSGEVPALVPFTKPRRSDPLS